MKKSWKLTLIACMFFMVTACSSNSGEGKKEETPKAENMQMEVVSSGWSKDGDYMYYGIVYKNPNTEQAIEFPKIKITVKDESGAVLASEEQVMAFIAAGDTLAYGSQVNVGSGTPSKVEFTPSNSETSFIEMNDKIISSSQIEVLNTSELAKNGATFTGEIKNNSSVNMSTAAVTVILKNNDEIVYGMTSYVDDINAGATSAFEVSSLGHDVPEHTSFEIYVQNW